MKNPDFKHQIGTEHIFKAVESLIIINIVCRLARMASYNFLKQRFRTVIVNV